MPERQIVALGGGGFSMEPDNPLLDDYIEAVS
jgi:dipeptidase E